ncbi:hypothetical protein RND71_029149 [Anisodus tanguticus]|uniref:DUF7915 domain-containing protein n=1 Tax=Anisodus tanguticus TaxID=243964 RepID=A0AAE1REW2_9SOLA|nr:hypothetical protein RND71_029149 [Anisodus tanguticus]
MRTCDISSTLDAVEVVPLSQKWPTSKVAVFLVDSRRENCLLMRSSMTCAGWSIIEKKLDGSSGLQELALSAVTEATVLLETVLVGPLIKKNPSEWMVAPAVEYFQLLPYREILSNWHSRKLLSNGLQELNVEVVADHADDVHIGGSSSEKEVNQENVAQPRVKLCNTDYDDEKIVEEKRRRGVQGISAVGLSQLGSQHSGDAVATLASKESAISQSALMVLRWKREKLVPASDIAIVPHYQLRILEDEIALGDKTIRTTLNEGQSDLPLKIEALIDGCNDMCVKGEGVGDSTNQLAEDQCIVQCSNGERACLGTGGFLAKVIVKGANSEFVSESNICEGPREARESAAAHMIARVAHV